MTKPATADGYILSELEVYGRGGLVPRPKPAPAADADGRLQLSRRRLAHPARFAGDRRRRGALARPASTDKDWLPATVPGTVLSSYWNAGAIPDPNYGDNISHFRFLLLRRFLVSRRVRRAAAAPPAATPG